MDVNLPTNSLFETHSGFGIMSNFPWMAIKSSNYIGTEVKCFVDQAIGKKNPETNHKPGIELNWG